MGIIIVIDMGIINNKKHKFTKLKGTKNKIHEISLLLLIGRCEKEYILYINFLCNKYKNNTQIIMI
jgi:hypothetical protein